MAFDPSQINSEIHTVIHSVDGALPVTGSHTTKENIVLLTYYIRQDMLPHQIEMPIKPDNKTKTIM